MRKSPNTVYIGYDPKEHTAYEVLKFTIERIAVENVRVVPIKRDVVERMGMYTRTYDTIDGQNIDTIDGKPFSSEFSFTRFLVPAMNMYEGWALYMDCDMYLRTDINELFKEYNTDYYPLYCVKHDYAPGDGYKMDGRKQENYRRKNWSSLMLFNCSHELNKRLTPEVVNTMPGGWLHGFEWFKNGTGWMVILQKILKPRTYTLRQAVLGLKIGNVVGILMVCMLQSGMVITLT